ncbi:hypothetical protein ACFQ9V_08780 [Leifsonia sp. NPDC056665]|uniref:hypothetical protein n=1 Tax=Leifsonia sp. NPDC056665 TaxID=3345901 RepID=UPI0036ACEF05
MLNALPNDTGRYVVTTRSGSKYTFDLAAGTVTRELGDRSRPTINDGTRPIRQVITCAVGYPGYWTMEPDDDGLDYYWQLTSPIVTIQRLDEDGALHDD